MFTHTVRFICLGFVVFIFLNVFVPCINLSCIYLIVIGVNAIRASLLIFFLFEVIMFNDLNNTVIIEQIS